MDAHGDNQGDIERKPKRRDDGHVGAGTSHTAAASEIIGGAATGRLAADGRHDTQGHEPTVASTFSHVRVTFGPLPLVGVGGITAKILKNA